jgi:hypothetical protein
LSFDFSRSYCFMILRKKSILRRHATSFEKRASSLIFFEISSTI